MNHKELNITTWKTLTQDDLKERILKAVQNTQSGSLIMPLPDILLLRPDQYVILQDDPDMLNMFESEDRLFRTPLNVMEIRVDTRGLTEDERYNPAGEHNIT